MPTNLGKYYENRTIVLPFDEATYPKVSLDAVRYRKQLKQLIESHPNLFPPEIKDGFQMKDIYRTERFDTSTSSVHRFVIRRIKVAGTAYTVRPSFVLPNLAGLVSESEDALFLRKFDVPFWALAHVFGHSSMHWCRLEQTVGRYSIVETTVQNPEDLPEHLAADEKHSWLNKAKVYIATICGFGCILGVSVAENADEASLTESYGVFKAEAQALKPNYEPKSINVDGWLATSLALQSLFPNVALIFCFLHMYLSLRDRSKLKFSSEFHTVSDKLWHCYHAATQAAFSQRLRRLYEWSKDAAIPDFMREKLARLYQKADAFRAAYRFPFAHRTSNMVDRLMQRMNRHLTNTQYFHGTKLSAELSIRGWALIQNFAPFNPYTIEQNMGWRSPAEALNQSRYHESWLQNLFISTSLVGKYRSPQKAL